MRSLFGLMRSRYLSPPSVATAAYSLRSCVLLMSQELSMLRGAAEPRKVGTKRVPAALSTCGDDGRVSGTDTLGVHECEIYRSSSCERS